MSIGTHATETAVVPAVRTPATRPAVGPSDVRRRVLASVGLFGPSVFGVTSAAVALPAVAQALAVTPGAAGWLLTVHALLLGLSAAVFGRLTDVLGLRRILAAAATLLVVGTVILLLCDPLIALVAGRGVLAAGSGAAIAAALSINAATPPDHRARALGRFGLGIAVFASAATAAGGLVTAVATWRLALVLPVLSVLAIVPARTLATASRSRTRMDWPGAAVTAVTAGSVIVLLQARTVHLGIEVVIALLVVAVAGGLLTLHRVRTVPDSFVPRAIAAAGRLRLMVALGAATYAGFFAVTLLVPRHLAHEGVGTLQTGLLLLPGAAVGAFVARLLGRSGPAAFVRWLIPMEAGFGLTALLAWLTGGAVPCLILLAGFAFAAFAATQVVSAALVGSAVPAPTRGGVLAVMNLLFFLGGSAGAAIAGSLASGLGTSAAFGAVGALTGFAALVAVRLNLLTRAES